MSPQGPGPLSGLPGWLSAPTGERWVSPCHLYMELGIFSIQLLSVLGQDPTVNAPPFNLSSRRTKGIATRDCTQNLGEGLSQQGGRWAV